VSPVADAPVLTPAFVEREYDNRAAVPDHPAWFAKWASLSARARETLQPALDLRYGPNPKETLDLFVPATPARGALVFIHGGYWRALDKADHSFVAEAFVGQGFAVAVLNYDLCPAVSVACIVDECRRALAWIAREGARRGTGTGPIVVSGHSAGGQLAAMLLATDARSMGLAAHPVAGAVSVSGLHDLVPMTRFSYNADLGLDEAEAIRLSPTRLAPVSRAPIVAAVGARETSEFLRQARLLWDAWPANRPPAATGPLVVPDRHHFSVIADYADPASALTQATLALF
jgi:arylformamidase